MNKAHEPLATRSTTAKIKTNSDLAEALDNIRSSGDTIVHCHGVFDLVHPGHIRHLEEAARLGDCLVVTVTIDRFVNKGPGRPVFNSQLRAETLAALECVKFVSFSESPTAVDLIKKFKPHVYVKGPDYADPNSDVTGMFREEANAVAAVGGRMHITDDIRMSSSELINQHFDNFKPETREWITKIKTKFGAARIKEHVENLKDLKVLVVGEAIIDEYYFCSGLGKSAKDPILAFKYENREMFMGGSLAVANHVSGICNEVGVVSLVGENDEYLKFINDQLMPNVSFHPFGRIGAPTICKRRYVDSHTGGKLFELYTLEDTPLDATSEDTLLNELANVISEYDIVIVSDYGHGMITPKVASFLCKNANFLAVNTQANAGNRGFNTISRYSRADYVCLNGSELQLEMRMRQSGFQGMLASLADQMQCDKFTVTLGQAGSLHFDTASGFVDAPALALQVTDRVGAGDAVLSITSALVYKNTPWEIIAFLTNLAGAEVVAEIGNSKSLDSITLLKHLNVMR